MNEYFYFCTVMLGQASCRW